MNVTITFTEDEQKAMSKLLDQALRGHGLAALDNVVYFLSKFQQAAGGINAEQERQAGQDHVGDRPRVAADRKRGQDTDEGS